MKKQAIKIINSVALTTIFVLAFLAIRASSNDKIPFIEDQKTQNTIRVALLLDTSNSMDGLISQAKSQLWSIVNKLSEAGIEDKKSELEIALYEYGNDYLSAENGYIRRVMPFSTDLDLLSEKLFALKTNGGEEYCGYVIHKAMDELDWEGNSNDLNMIFIAGNEAFNQGSISYTEVAKRAKKKGMIINPIFCGDFEEGIRTSWKAAAMITGGEYMSIDQNKKTVYIESPYDADILKLNQKLNDTYIPYGSLGKENKQRQVTQDCNAESYGAVNVLQRAVCKSKSVYNNSGWDLVDAADSEEFKLEDVESESLPQELQKLSDKELKEYITQKKKERNEIQSKINKLNAQREKYIGEKGKNESNLENAILESIERLAGEKGYNFGC